MDILAKIIWNHPKCPIHAINSKPKECETFLYLPMIPVAPGASVQLFLVLVHVANKNIVINTYVQLVVKHKLHIYIYITCFLFDVTYITYFI